MKTFATLAVSAVALGLAATIAQAEEAVPLPPTHIINQLTMDGLQLRKLEAERGGYEARMLATDGTIVKVGIDAASGELTDAYSHARARKADAAQPAVDAAQAAQAVAMTGYWDVREVEFEDGAWRVAARDDAGKTGRFTVDGATGAVE